MSSLIQVDYFRILNGVLQYFPRGGVWTDLYELSSDELDALNGAASPSSGNVFVTTSALDAYIDDSDEQNTISDLAVATGETTLDWSSAKVFTLTFVSNTELFDSNLPVNPITKEVKIIVTANSNTLTVPTYWTLTGGSADTSKDNIYKVFCYDETATAKVSTITLTGTAGNATIGAAGGLSKVVTFTDDLTTSADNFVTDYAADYLAEKIVVTSDGADLIFTAQFAGYDFTSPTITNITGDMGGSVANTAANGTGTAQVDTVTISGNDGKVVIEDAGGLTKNVEFDTDLATTVSNFVSDYSSDYAAEGITVTADDDDIVFTAAVAGTGFTNPAKTQVVGDLDGSVANTQANVAAVAQVDTVTVTGTSGAALITEAGSLINSLVFDTDLNTTIANFVTNQAADYLAEDIVVTKVDAVAQVDTVTLTGTSGTADITGAGGLTKTATFNSDLTTTASDFVTAHAAAYAAEGITVTSSTADLIFTATVLGTAFTNPVITNATGDLDGSVVNTQANVTPKLVFTSNVAGTSFTNPVITNDYGDLAGSVANTQANVVAVAQVDTVTLTGTDGEASMQSAGGLTKEVRFDTDLTTTAANFVTDWASDYTAQAITISSSGADVIFTANVAGTGFTNPTISNVAWDLDANVANTQANVAKVAQVDTVTITGTEGKFTIEDAGGLTKVGEFNTSLTQTAADFVTDHAAAYAAEGITLTSSSDDLIFTSDTAGVAFTNPTINAIVSDLDGSVAATQANVSPKVFYSIEKEA